MPTEKNAAFLPMQWDLNWTGKGLIRLLLFDSKVASYQCEIMDSFKRT
jgi:hypothetical protein